MRYFFLAYVSIALLVVGLFGWRGQKFAKPPIWVFRDMDMQDVLRAQQPDAFFANGQGARLPVAQTQPRGFNEDGSRELGGIPEYEFGGDSCYYFTGQIGDYFGTGMPEELKLTADNATTLIQRGQEVFTITCALCHGSAGDGQGISSAYGVPVAANPNAKLNAIPSPIYPDGRIFNTITQGKGMMGAYGPNISIRDRWAVVAYIRTLQAATASRHKDP
ncbi:MAG: cytochrome c [Verrucomicrobiota bacterium]